MNIFDIVKKRFFSNRYKTAQTLNWHTPSYYANQNYNIYNSDVVQQALRCILQEIKKLEPRHVVRNSGRDEICFDSIQFTLENPNELMTTSDFLEKVVYNLLINSNSFVLPVWDNGELTALYPLQPTTVDFLQDNSNTLFVKFTFSNDYESTIRYSDVIHIRYNFGASEFMGGDVLGNPDIKAIQRGVNLNESLLDGIQKSIKSSYAVNGVVRYNTMLDDGSTQKALDELTEKLNNNESGFLPLDLKSEFTPLDKNLQIVDEATLKFVDEKVLRNWGVSTDIISGNFTKEQYEAFYQKVLEPIVISLSQAFTKAIFSRAGRTVLGNKIIFYTSLLNFMSMTEKKEIGTLLSTTGAIQVDELRSLFGYAPCDDRELGKTFILSKNYGDAHSVKDMVDKETDSIKSLANSKSSTN